MNDNDPENEVDGEDRTPTIGQTADEFGLDECPDPEELDEDDVIDADLKDEGDWMHSDKAGDDPETHTDG